MKKFISFNLAVIVIFFLMNNVNLYAYSSGSGTCGDNITWIWEGSSFSVTGTGDMYDYNNFDNPAPWSFLTAFGECDTLSVSEGVTSIGDGSFINLKVNNIIIPKTITKIGDGAFSGCERIKEIYLPEGLIEIGDRAFNKCTSLESIYIPESVVKIGDNAFEGCINLSEVHLSGGLKELGQSAFRYCEKIGEITIPDSITKIEFETFSGCSLLENIYISENVTVIQDGAFSSCENLKNIYVDERNPSYASHDGVLYNKEMTNIIQCPGGKEFLELSENLRIISQRSLDGCEKLKTLHIPRNVNELTNAFNSCKSLTEITVDEHNASFASYDGLLLSKDRTKIIKCPSGKTMVDIPKDVEIIVGDAFEDCDNLKEIVVPDNVKEIYSHAFFGCDTLEKVVVSKNISKVADSLFSQCAALKEVVFNGEVNCIMNNAFYGCSSLEYINIPVNLTKISSSVFEKCSSLKSVIIPDSVTDIEGGAFKDCKNLESVALPVGLKTIGNSAFENCQNLKYINFPDGLTRIESSAFSFCGSLENINLPGSIAEISEFAFNFCSSLSEIILHEGTTTIGECAFQFCDWKQCAIPSSIRYIREGAFNSWTYDENSIIYYSGNEVDWNDINIEEQNQQLSYSKINYNYKIPEVKVFYNNNRVLFSQLPIIQNGRTLVPVRAVFETLGAAVEWIDDTQTVVSIKDGITVSMTIGSNKMYKNDQEIIIDVAPQILNSRTLVPIRIIAESFDFNVEWNEGTQTVMITEKDSRE